MKAFSRVTFLMGVNLLASALWSHAAERGSSGQSPLVVGITWPVETTVAVEDAASINRFEVDLAIALARTQGRSVKFRLAPLSLLLRELNDGQIDFLPGIARTPDRQKFLDFSVPHSRLQTQIFFRRGYTGIHSPADLRGRTVIVVKESYSSDWALQRSGAAKVIQVADLTEGVRRLSAGEGDCLLAKQINIFAAIQATGVKNINVRGPPIPELLQDLCIAVRGGNRDLLAEMNEGLFQLKQTGELDRIYEHWLGLLDPSHGPFTRYVRYLVFTLVVIVLLAVIAWSAHVIQIRRTRARLAEIEVRVKERTKELASAKARLEAVITNTPAAVLLMDAYDTETPGRIVDCNETTCRMHGYTKEELIGRSINLLRVETFSPDDFAAIAAELKTKRRRHGQCHHRCKDGTILSIEYYSALIQIDGREYVLAVDLDVTDRIRTETALRRNEEFQRLVLRATNDGIFDWEIGADIFVLSARGWQLLGFAENELPATRAGWWQRLHPDDRRQAEDLLDRHLREGVPFVHTARYLHLNGSVRWLLCRADTLRDAGGAPARMVGSYSDVTDQKRTDEELQLSRRLRAMGELVGGIAHEFNNLLTPILLQSSLLAESTPQSTESAGQIESVLDAARRAQTLTRQLLQFGRQQEDNPAPQSVGAVVDGTLSLVRSTIDRRIEIHLEEEPSLPLVRLNATTFGQVVMNLVLNARDALMERSATGAPGWIPQLTVRLSTCEAPDAGARNTLRDQRIRSWLRLSVIDNGAGMLPEVRERIFEPFFTTKTVGQGTGLGLSMVWRVVEALGGWVEVESVTQRGTEFNLYLPATTDSAVAGKPAVPIQTADPVGRRRLLLVEDDESVGSVLSRILQHLGHEVTWVRSGDAAMCDLKDNISGYDALFTDLNMPGIDGSALVTWARQTGFRGKVAVLSGNITAEAEARLRTAGDVALLQKPFEFDRIKALLGDLWS
ncbi:MAG TPA: transporter substrate-binding domain-containing protein [Lacunisphaera sp.]|jgi:PAS domain S-box-containing protein